MSISVVKHMVWSNLRRVLKRRLLDTFPIILMGRRPNHLFHFIKINKEITRQDSLSLFALF